jgi:hypothetical protein
LRWNAEKHAWVCWGHPPGAKNRSGSTIDLICILEGIEEDEAIERVMAGYVGGDARIESLNGSLGTKTRQLPVRIPWPEECEPLRADAPLHRTAWAYLASRGIGPEEVERYRLGYGVRGRYAGRILFPCFMRNELMFYQARATWDPPAGLEGERLRSWVEAHRYRKVLNPTGASAQGKIFGYDIARLYEHVVVCEGPADAIKTGPFAVAVLGKDARSPETIAALRSMGAKYFTIYFDSGPQARLSAFALGRELSTFAAIFIAEPKAGNDPGKQTRQENASCLHARQPFSTARLG